MDNMDNNEVKKMEYQETLISVVPPRNVPFEVIAGGYCRDAIVGEKAKDCDMYFSDKVTYIECLRVLGKSGGRMKETGHKLWGENDGASVSSKWIVGKDSFDVFLTSFESTPELIDHLMDRFDFSINCCYQVSGDGNVKIKGDLSMIEGRTAELNGLGEERLTSEVLCRALYFKRKGWNIGSSIVSFLVGRIERYLDDPKEYHEDYEIYFTKRGDSEYGYNYKPSRCLFDDLLEITSDDNLMLFLLSPSDNLLSLAQEEHNRRKEGGDKDGVMLKVKKRLNDLLKPRESY